ncbi:tyrosine-type recombinase/integrase [Moritella viscosa]|uniref:tyrosine-type recombinase/integrase n=1 Tax=Moritella viscosa TaxID=80854 RepID=UPI00406CC5A6
MPSALPTNSSKNRNLTRLDGLESVFMYERNNYDYAVSSYNYFPIILNHDDKPWELANLYLLEKLESVNIPNYKTLESIANDLVMFKRYIDNYDIDYLSFPKRKLRRPTYSYRAFLHEKMVSGEFAVNTVQRKMNSVIGFYRWLNNQPDHHFEYPMWNESDSYISFYDNSGFSITTAVKKTDLSVDIPKVNNDFEHYIQDGGKLKPLSIQQQESLISVLFKIGNIEMLFSFLIALCTGARLQTVFTLRIGNFEFDADDDSPLFILTGMGTLVDSKYNKQTPLIIPPWLSQQIKRYIHSERAEKRRCVSVHYRDNLDSQYVFLTKSGRPYYLSKHDPLISNYRNPARGDAIRPFIRDAIIPELNKLGHSFNFKFHDLRATFCLNLIEQKLEDLDNGLITRIDLLMLVRERMGHSRLSTTETYLNFRSSYKLLMETQGRFEAYLKEMLDGEMNVKF